IVEDVITAGTAIRESMANLSKLEGTKIAATFVMVDRKEKGKGELSAMAEIEAEFGFPSTRLLMFTTSLSTSKRTLPTRRTSPVSRTIWLSTAQRPDRPKSPSARKEFHYEKSD
ncbi:MAG: hypothetical protein IKD28_04315, partial [Clostridia bacterium]|nr:hypothetical protein [Clostridia bacterium]